MRRSVLVAGHDEGRSLYWSLFLGEIASNSSLKEDIIGIWGLDDPPRRGVSGWVGLEAVRGPYCVCGQKITTRAVD